MLPDISVVIPTFRRPAELTLALESALSQQGVTLEVLVLDDSPEGSAREVVAGLADPRVSYIKQEVPSQGRPALVRNAGWQQAKGQYVHFLDDDDRVAEGAYGAMLAALSAHPDRGVVFGKIEPFGDDPVAVAKEQAYFQDAARRARVAARVGSRRWMVANMLFRTTLLVNSACLIRRECIAPLGGYDAELPIVEDVDFYARAIRQFGCVFLDQVTVHYRISAGSLMHGQKDNHATLQAYRKMYSAYRAQHGLAELLGLKLFSRSLLRLL